MQESEKNQTYFMAGGALFIICWKKSSRTLRPNTKIIISLAQQCKREILSSSTPFRRVLTKFLSASLRPVQVGAKHRPSRAQCSFTLQARAYINKHLCWFFLSRFVRVKSATLCHCGGKCGVRKRE